MTAESELLALKLVLREATHRPFNIGGAVVLDGIYERGTDPTKRLMVEERQIVGVFSQLLATIEQEVGDLQPSIDRTYAELRQLREENARQRNAAKDAAKWLHAQPFDAEEIPALRRVLEIARGSR